MEMHNMVATNTPPDIDTSSLAAVQEYIRAHPTEIFMGFWENTQAERSECGTTHCIGGTQLILHYKVSVFANLPPAVKAKMKETGPEPLCLAIMHIPEQPWVKSGGDYSWVYYADEWPKEYYKAYRHFMVQMDYTAVANTVCKVIQLYIDNQGKKPVQA